MFFDRHRHPLVPLPSSLSPLHSPLFPRPSSLAPLLSPLYPAPPKMWTDAWRMCYVPTHILRWSSVFEQHQLTALPTTKKAITTSTGIQLFRVPAACQAPFIGIFRGPLFGGLLFKGPPHYKLICTNLALFSKTLAYMIRLNQDT